jgi:hypothetical protein
MLQVCNTSSLEVARKGAFWANKRKNLGIDPFIHTAGFDFHGVR